MLIQSIGLWCLITITPSSRVCKYRTICIIHLTFRYIPPFLIFFISGTCIPFSTIYIETNVVIAISSMCYAASFPAISRRACVQRTYPPSVQLFHVNAPWFVHNASRNIATIYGNYFQSDLFVCNFWTTWPECSWITSKITPVWQILNTFQGRCIQFITQKGKQESFKWVFVKNCCLEITHLA